MKFDLSGIDFQEDAVPQLFCVRCRSELILSSSRWSGKWWWHHAVDFNSEVQCVHRNMRYVRHASKAEALAAVVFFY